MQAQAAVHHLCDMPIQPTQNSKEPTKRTPAIRNHADCTRVRFAHMSALGQLLPVTPIPDRTLKPAGSAIPARRPYGKLYIRPIMQSR
jgi:hypothetical protein